MHVSAPGRGLNSAILLRQEMAHRCLFVDRQTRHRLATSEFYFEGVMYTAHPVALCRSPESCKLPNTYSDHVSRLSLGTCSKLA